MRVLRSHMNSVRIVGMLVLLALGALPAHSQPLPRDVARFVRDRDLCEHFRNEEPYDAERRVFLQRRVDEFCKGMDRRLAALKRKYKADSAVQSKLQTYEVEIEASTRRQIFS